MTTIPAGAGEKMQYIVHDFNDNTIRFVLRYPGQLQADLLRQAVFAIVSRIDVLHASFAADKRDAHWQVNAVRPEDCFTLVSVPGDPTDAALTQALQPITADSPVQMRCVLVQGAEDCAVVVLISHLCADGSDGKYLLHKLCEAYNLLLERGSCGALAVKNGSRAVEQVYSYLSKQELRKLMRDPRTGVKCVFPFPTEAEGQPAVLHRRIPAEVMSAAHDRVKGMNATINDLLLTACYYAYAAVTAASPDTPLSIMSMMDLRRHCDGGDSQGLCNLTGALATALPGGLCPTFADTLAAIAAQTRRSKEDPLAGLYGMPLLHGAANKLPMALLLSVSSRVYGSMAVGLTNIGSMDSASLRLGDALPCAGWFGGPVKRKPGVQVSAASFDGACTLSLWSWAAEDDKPMLQRLLDGMADHVRKFSI